MGHEQGDSLQRFHFSEAVFLGQLYPEEFLAKSMVLKRFTRRFYEHDNLDPGSMAVPSL